MKNEKLFVAGYYNEGRYDDLVLLDKNIDVYSLDQILNLGFLGLDALEDFYNNTGEVYEKDFDKLTNEELGNLAIEYVSSDELAFLAKFETEKEALEYKEKCLKELREFEEDINNGNLNFSHKISNGYGGYYSIYEYHICE